MARKRREDRGFVLLIVLSLLTIFTLMAATFLVVAGNYRAAASAAAQIGPQQPEPRQLTDDVLFSLLVDTNDPQSVIRGHSLLRDMYGDDGFTATVNRSSRFFLTPDGNPTGEVLAGGQFLDVYIRNERTDSDFWQAFVDTNALRRNLLLTNSANYPHTYSGQWLELSPLVGYYNGCVLTFTSGPLSGSSARIIDYTPISEAGMFLHRNNSRFRIMPIGSWPTNLRIDQELNVAGSRVVVNGRPFSGSGFGYANGATLPVALQPNQLNVPEAAFQLGFLSGGADESYDAADHQNMHLAAISEHPTDPGRLWVLPSFHRPRLNALNPLASMRPPDSTFDGSNPEFQLSSPEDPRWDIDNDGDGIPDSIWLDAGLPIQTDREGRRFKPLAAILCVDLDGRLNVNADGSGPPLDPMRYPQDLAGNPDLAPIPITDATAVVSLRRPAVGVGTGPADVNLGVVFGEAAYNLLWQRQIGADGVAGRPGPDFATVYRNFERSFADLRSERMVGLDHRGQPRYSLQANATNNPYEKNLLTPNSTDTLYTISELEGLLRFNDDDVTAPRVLGAPRRMQSTSGRLTALFDNLFVPAPSNLASFQRAARNRRLVTTHSCDLPVPNIAPPIDLRRGVGSKWFHHTAAILRERLITGFGLAEPLSPTDEQRINVQIDIMLSRDLMMGLRMDVNRPFGNGVDDDGNGVIDEPSELLNVEPINVEPIWNGVFPNVSPVPFDHRSESMRSRYARNLYVLLMMLADQSALADGINQADVSRVLAQWAVNAVDFRDSDSIMTRFDFDLQPFDGWQANDFVWGAERPEMLITETLAYHNLRTKDTDVGGTMQQGDQDFDQINRPLGSFYVELYNPWTDTFGVDPIALNNELYETAGGKRGLRLDKRVPAADATTPSSPIWRLVVAPPMGDVDRRKEQFITADPEVNVIYLGCGRSGLVQDAGVDFPKNTVDNPRLISNAGDPSPFGLLGGGEYAVVGTVRASTDLRGTNPIVRRNPDDVPGPGTNTRWIGLSADDPPAVTISQVEGEAPEVRNVSVVIPIERLNISEDPAYDSIGIDDKLDLNQPMDGDRLEIDGDNGLKVVHLQRLADPLLEWDPAMNPYLTVDSMPVELVVFNGPGPTPEGQADAFFTAQRGRPDSAEASSGELPRLLWKQNSPDPPETTPEIISADAATATREFNRRLNHTLGFLNQTYGLSTDVPAVDVGPVVNRRTYVGVPNKPFPWLTWLNRPYVSQYEMQLVPRSSSFNLLKDFGRLDKTRNMANPTGLETLAGEFSHLLNFYWDGGGLPQLFEFTHVPSQFAGTETVLNPEFVVNRPDFRHLQPPFNRISTYREPGKVNLNTVYDRSIIDALRGAVDDDSNLTAVARGIGPRFFQVALSRSGVTPAPTYFANPFRRFGGTDLPGATDPAIEATLLRSFGSSRLFSAERQNLFESHNDPDRNPYFRYGPLQRFANLVTTRSNVYAIWVTVGFFEVEDRKALPDVDPLGYRLGSEVGWDTGDIRRHRSFYIVDRTIPVAFEPGKRHNAEDTILLRRFIE